MPSSIDEIVKTALKLLELQDGERTRLAIDALGFLTAAGAPLTLEALCHAIESDLRSPDLITDEIPVPASVFDCCMGLIAVDPGTNFITFAHYDIEQYMRRHRNDLFANAPDNAKMAKSCIAYISLDAFSNYTCHEANDLHHCLQQYPFLDYASRHWGQHAREALSLDFDGKIIDDISRLLSRGKRKNLELSLQISGLYPETCEPSVVAGDDDLVLDSNRDRYSTVSSLQVATRYGLIKVVQNMLRDSPGTVLDSDSNGTTALHEAAMAGWEDPVHLLLKAGARPTAVNEQAKSPLNYAVEAGYVHITSVLQEHARNEGSLYPPQMLSLIRQAAGFGHKSIVAILAPESNSAELEKSLCNAIEAGHTSVFEYLMNEVGVSPNAAKDDISAILLAVKADNQTALHLLCKAGSSVACKDGTSSDRITLHQAIRHGRLGVAHVLMLFEANLETRDDRGRTVLFEALNAPDISAAEFLLSKGIDIMSRDDAGESIMHEVVKEDATKYAILFLDQGIKADVQDFHGATPLDLALLHEKHDMTALLIHSGASHHIAGTTEKTKLERALSARDPSIFQILKKSRARHQRSLAALSLYQSWIDHTHCYQIRH